MLTVANLVARGLHVLVTECVARGATHPIMGISRYRLTAEVMPAWDPNPIHPLLDACTGIDWWPHERRLVLWRQDFPGADLDVYSDLTAPLMAHTR